LHLPEGAQRLSLFKRVIVHSIYNLVDTYVGREPVAFYCASSSMRPTMTLKNISHCDGAQISSP